MDQHQNEARKIQAKNMIPSVDILEIVEITDEIVTAFQRLIPQLTSNNSPPTKNELVDIAASPATILLAARDRDRDDEIVGTLSLVLFRTPTGLRARIEDAVVDAGARGKGVGQALTLAALERAKEAGARGVDLTSRPHREAANRLYRRLGFEIQKTNPYRFTFSKKQRTGENLD